MTPAALRHLVGLVEARKARDLARLEGLIAEDRRLGDEIAALTTTAARDLADEAARLPLRQQGLRQTWVDQRIRAVHRRRGELAAEIRAARTAAVQSLGRHGALEGLVVRAERTEDQRRIARAEREAPPAAGRIRT